jgi:VWFA-related protein
MTLTAQNSTTQSQPQLAGNPVPPSDYTVRTYTRLVNLEVVIKDSKGNHIQGLEPEDFSIEEQTPIKSGKWSGQKIAEFREVHMGSLAAPVEMQPEMPPGSYTNALTVRQDPVPPTIILVDGLNTPVEVQPQVHVQMLKMLRQLPPNVPVAVFLLGDRLTLLQSFTRDPKLLQAALEKAHSTAAYGMQMGDPRDDSNSIGNLLAEAGGGTYSADMVAALAAFDQSVYSGSMSDVVGRTLHALSSLANNVSGYPGRKNLLWISTSFPISLMAVSAVGAPVGVPTLHDWAELPNYTQEVERLTRILSDAKVAVYPVNPAGVQTLQLYQAGSRITQSQATPQGFSQSTTRDVMTQNAAVDTMHMVADGTGGIVCTGDNDLGDCVRKAVDDSSDFYEISYYSDSPYWNGEARKIAVKSTQHGARLEYREGYFASPEGNPDPKLQSAELQSDCDDFLNATSVTFTAKSLPSDAPGDLKFSLVVDPAAVTFAPTADGAHQLHLDVAVCTYNRKDWPINLMNYPVNMKLTAQQFNSVMSTGKLTDTIRVPGPEPAALRLMVKDVTTGKLGSVYIKTGDLMAQSTASSGNQTQQTKQ